MTPSRLRQGRQLGCRAEAGPHQLHTKVSQRESPNFTLKLVRPGLRSGSRAAYLVASVTASRPLQFATRFHERHSRQPPRRFGFGTRALAAQLSTRFAKFEHRA